MKQKDFEIFIPISKSIKSEGEHGRFIRGWASVPKEDRDGDLILPTDLSINPFMKQGYINYEHKKGGIYKLGVPTDKTYIDLKRGLFIEAKLFDDSPYADKMWNLAEKVNSGELDVNDDNMLGFSIEAHYSHRDYDDPRILRNVIVTNVALTTHPSNTSASWSTFVKSFTTGSDIVGDGDTGGATFRKQSFARDLRQLSYTIKSFSQEDWSDICSMLDDEGRYDRTVAKAIGLMYEINKSDDNDDDTIDTFKSYMNNMFGEPIDSERNNEVQEINKSSENVEQENVVDTSESVASTSASEVASETATSESATAESAVTSEAPASESEATSETATSESAVTSEAPTSESEASNQESEVSSESAISSEVTSETPTSEATSETDNTQSESAIVDSQSTSESAVSTSESEAVPESESAVSTSESEATSETPASEAEVPSESNASESEQDNKDETLDSDVSKLTSKIEQLEEIIKGLKEDIDKQKIDIPDVGEKEESSENKVDEKPSRRVPEETDGSDVANREPINPDSEESETDGSESEENSEEDSKVKVDGFLEKIENNLPEIRYRLLPSEFIAFNNALRHLRSGSATAEDGQILQETLKTVGIRSQVQ